MNAFYGMQINEWSVFYSLAFCSGNYLSVFELSAGKKLACVAGGMRERASGGRAGFDKTLTPGQLTPYWPPTDPLTDPPTDPL